MPHLELIFGDQVIPFPAGRFVLGSGADCAVRLSGPNVRPQHAEVMQETDGTWWVRDISGSGSVRVDGATTWESQLVGGSFLSVGAVDLSVRESGEQGSGTVMRRSQSNPALELTEDARGPRRPLRPDEVRTAPEAPAASPPAYRPPKRHLDPGEIIDERYRIVKRLAAGGMGEVYEAEHVELHKPVAVKVMLPELSKDAEFVARFKREAIASSRIGQHNIVDISDFGRTRGGRFYFVMELLDGKTLAVHAHDGAMSQRRAANIVLQIGRALMAAHDRGIVHRDLKPENVMLLQRPGQPDFVKVLDFGIAKVNEGHGAGGLTQIGMVVGTPQYMSPEQAAGLPVDARTDIYSLGLILYELLAGRPTFKGETPSMLMAMQMTAAPPPLAPGPIELPVAPELEELVFHLLQKKPEERPQSMHEVVDRLEPHIQGPISSPRVPTGPASGQSRILPLTATPLPLAPIRRGGTQQDMPMTPAPLPALGTDVSPAPPTVQVPKSPAKTIATVLAICLVLAVGLGIAAFINGRERVSEPAPIVIVPPPPPRREEPVPREGDRVAAPQKLSLTFETKPTGAEVFEDDVLVGTSPVTLSRERDQVISLRFELKGYRPLARKVRFEEGERMVLIELEKKGGGAAPKKPDPLHDNPYSNVTELKDLPD